MVGGQALVTGPGASLNISPDANSAGGIVATTMNAQIYGSSVLYLLSGYNGSYPLGGTGLGTLSFRNLSWSQGANITSFATESHSASAAGANLRFFTTPNGTTSVVDRLIIDQNGNVGIGTTSPGTRLDISNGTTFNPGANALGALRLSGSYGGGLVFSDTAYAGIWAVDGGHTLAFGSNGSSGGFGNPYGQMVLKDGNVGMGTSSPSSKLHVVGDVTVTGNISAKYQDIAEWVPAAEPIVPGTVVIVDSDGTNTVLPSSHSYDTRVAGVVSATPGITLGERAEGKVKVATTGRVRVRVDASLHPIRAGDLLVSSDTTGAAMKSEPVTFGGIQMHRPGTLIGKALEPLSEGEGEILVLLSLQ